MSSVCAECGLIRIAYNSCLMGKFGNGELAGGRVADPAGTSNDCGRLFSRFAPHNVAVPEIDVSSDDCDPAARGRRQGDTMFGDIFCGTEGLERPARGSERALYGWLCRLAQTRRIRCCHRGTLSARGGPPWPFSAKSEAEHWPRSIYRPFFRHLRTCRCPTVGGREAQPPTLVRRQALPRLPRANRCLPMQRGAGDSECRPGTRRRLSTVVAEASRCWQNRPSGSIPVVQPSCFGHLATIPRAGMRRACAPIFGTHRSVRVGTLKSWLPAYGLSCGISASMAGAEPTWIRPCRGVRLLAPGRSAEIFDGGASRPLDRRL